MIETEILAKLIPYIIPAFVINILLDILKCLVPTKMIKWVMPIVAFIISLIMAIIYSLLIKSSGFETFIHSLSIIGISFFIYDIGGYKWIKKRLSKLISKGEEA